MQKQRRADRQDCGFSVRELGRGLKHPAIDNCIINIVQQNCHGVMKVPPKKSHLNVMDLAE